MVHSSQVNAVQANNKMQLTSGGLNGALRAPSSMRRLQLILVLDRRVVVPPTSRDDGREHE